MIEDMGKNSGYKYWKWQRYDAGAKERLLKDMEKCEKHGQRYTLTFELEDRPAYRQTERRRGVWPFVWTRPTLESVMKPTAVWGLTVEAGEKFIMGTREK